MNKLIIIILLFTLTFSSRAQEPDLSDKTITWNCAKTIDHTGENVLSKESKLISGPNMIKWMQGDDVQEFVVTDRNWNWSDGSGTITYKVEFNGAIGKVKIKKNRIDIDLKIDTKKAKFSLDVIDYTL